jgi:hypothetical protein
MKNFHANIYGEIVKCKNTNTCTANSTHFTLEEANLIKQGDTENYELTDEQAQFNLNHINHKQNKQFYEALNKRQFGASPEDYESSDHNRIKRVDPFRLNTMSFRNFQQEVLDDSGQSFNTSKNLDSHVDTDFNQLWNVCLGRYKPRKATNINLVKFYFESKIRIIVPAGTLIRTTKPSDKEKGFKSPTKKNLHILHVNSGSEPTLAEDIKYVSVTWLGLNGWLYNVEVNQVVLDAN